MDQGHFFLSMSIATHGKYTPPGAMVKEERKENEFYVTGFRGHEAEVVGGQVNMWFHR